jgi:hypothetical protein
VKALNETVKKGGGGAEEVVAIFGPEGKDLIDSSDPVAARRRREVFAIAMKEGWRLVDEGPRKTLVVGNEAWPFPVPLVQDANGWRFDTAAGKEEVIARRIGRNELAAILICRTYVAAQRSYARNGHDGKRAGLYARVFRSEPNRQNGLYWASTRGQPHSPIGDLLPRAAEERQPAALTGEGPAPFYGYHFKILTAQGASAPGGAKDYVDKNDMSNGFALVAWPAQYDVSGVMTFVVNQDRIVYQKDLGSGTDSAARSMALYDPDPSWSVVD